ncbi:hypothetical protein AB0I72_07830 [Nocardiopsis sp. NPDC049922]|uniref:hypothetical protein n=1 Tax=Nocardiopsis sp. NPDC049922 TaxID=3155157 RepID=UPI0033F631B3
MPVPPPTPVWKPVVANLFLGVFALIPLFFVFWLVTYLLPMDCRSVEEMGAPGIENCNYTTLDHYPVVLTGLVVFGGLLILLTLLVDVAIPLWRKRSPGPWLAWTPLIAVPYLVFHLLTGGWGGPGL